jgi:predicted RNase H-like HicB family nuclease
MKRHQIVIFWSDEDQVYIASVPDLPGCMSHGDTPEEALRMVQEAMDLWIDVARENGEEIPPPGMRAIASRSQGKEGEIGMGDVVVERCRRTGLYIGYMPGSRGVHTQAETLDELRENFRVVAAMRIDDGWQHIPAAINLTIEADRETDGRWFAQVTELPGVITYGATEAEATRNAKALALRVIADRVEHDEAPTATVRQDLPGD